MQDDEGFLKVLLVTYSRLVHELTIFEIDNFSCVLLDVFLQSSETLLISGFNNGLIRQHH
jgi:hypothetical protein